MKKTTKAIAAAFTAAAMAACMLPAVSAVDRLDLTKKVSLTVGYNVNEDDDADGKEGVVADIYKVADATASTQSDTYTLTACKDFDDMSEVLAAWNTGTAESFGADEWDAAAQTALAVVAGGKGKVAQTVELGRAVVETKEVMQGTTEEMAAGLYLVVYRTAGQDAEFEELEVEDEEDTVLVSVTQTTRYKYSYKPQLIALPTKASLNTEAFTVQEDKTVENPWQYTAAVNEKRMQELRSVGIKVNKTLKSVNPLHDSLTVVFKLTASWKQNGNDMTNSAVLGVTVGETTNNENYIDYFAPVGATVTVEEIYSGIGYSPVGDNTLTKVLTLGENVEEEEDGMLYATFSFTNEYNGSLTQDGGVVNRFDQDEKGQYQWSQNGKTPEARPQ